MLLNAKQTLIATKKILALARNRIFICRYIFFVLVLFVIKHIFAYTSNFSTGSTHSIQKPQPQTKRAPNGNPMSFERLAMFIFKVQKLPSKTTLDVFFLQNLTLNRTITQKIPYMGNTRPSRRCVIQKYQYYTMSLSQYHGCCQYHKFMSIL